MTSEPRRDRAEMPEGYGVPETEEGLLEWAAVEARLVASAQYWMATTRLDARPHVVPRWGVWLDGGLYYDGAPTTVHARNLGRNPACTLHLENGWEAVVVDGTAAPADPPGLALGARIAEAMAGKYRDRGYAPEPDAWEGEGAGGLVRFSPAKVLAWFDFPTDVTRFSFV
jgi:nitroimidazol reductase NimA-like FMN-containing flavoprotein (pyridoxamine 5'-phosphate oxidase superfamily)